LDETNTQITIDVSAYTTGVYSISLISNGQIITSESLIKQ